MMSLKQFVKFSIAGLKHGESVRIYYHSILSDYFNNRNWFDDKVIVYNKDKALVLFNWLKDQKENKMEENRPDKLTRYTFNLITDLCAYLSEFTDMHDYADTMYSIGNLCHSFVHTQYAWKASYKTKNRKRLLDLCKALEIKAVDKRAFYKHK